MFMRGGGVLENLFVYEAECCAIENAPIYNLLTINFIRIAKQTLCGLPIFCGMEIIEK